MRVWEELDEEGRTIDRVVMNKETIVDDFQWLQKNIGGTWRLSETQPSQD